MSWVVDNSRIDDTPKTEIKIDAIGALVTHSVYLLDTQLVYVDYKDEDATHMKAATT